MGTTAEPDLAIIWGWQSWWALELEWRPSVDLSYLDRLSAFYECAWRGGALVVSYFSGIVDEQDTIHPGALRDLLGFEVEEFLPLHAGE